MNCDMADKVDQQTVNCPNSHCRRSFEVAVYADYRTQNGQTLVCPQCNSKFTQFMRQLVFGDMDSPSSKPVAIRL